MIDSINSSAHSGAFGLKPSEVDSSLEGEIELELLRRKLKPESTLSTEEQRNLERNFFSKKKNQLLKVGRYCLADALLSKPYLSKGHTPKRSLICKVHSIDFTSEPILFTLETAFGGKVLPVKVISNVLILELNILIGHSYVLVL